MKKRIFSILLCMAMVVGLLPTYHIHAEWDEGVDCEFCGEHIYGDWVCDGGDHCSEDSDHFDCFDEHHCTLCLECFDEEPEFRCADCGAGPCCYDESEICKECGCCVTCVGPVCLVCGHCAYCTEEGAICEFCGQCYDCGGICTEGLEHLCASCHDGYACPDCGQCLLNPEDDEEVVEYCSNCRRCENCVEKCSAWGSDHYYCLECHNDFDYCPDCKHCYAADIISMVPGTSYGCEECNLCANCVSTICEECGKCYECVGICERCGKKCLDCHEGDDNVCLGCGMCFEGVGGHAACGYCWECLSSCPDCGRCMECYEDKHCPDCGACSTMGGANLCEGCGRCENCTLYCDTCHECEECNPDEHCSACGEHCDEDALCPDCGLCADCADLCSGCGYCEDCADEESHCSACGACAEDKAICEYCGMCNDCAIDANQHCSDPLCGNCYENYFYCPVCDKCDECIGEDDYCYECYQCKAHHESGECEGDGSHTHKVGNDWKVDKSHHWKECRLCKQEQDKAVHTFNAQKKCTICGYDTTEPITITQQPKDAHARVSDKDAEPTDALHVDNNRVSFRVSVTIAGKGRLSYQWYKVENGHEQLLTDGDGIKGATTAKLTTYVATDACSVSLKYYCKITLKSSTDEVLATVDSDKAELIASHVYNSCEPVPRSSSDYYRLYFMRGSNVVHLDVYENTGKHQYYCCGEGGCDLADPKRTAEPCTYGTPQIVKASKTSSDPNDFTDWYVYTCLECGKKHYVEKHVHQFELIDDYLTNADSKAFLEANCTDETHPLRCTVEGCGAIAHENHEFVPRVYAYPEKNGSAVDTGEYVLECLQCEYTLGGKTLYESNAGRSWGNNFTLVIADDAAVQVNKFGTFKALCLAAPDEVVLLTPIQKNGKKIVGWTAKYTDYTHEESSKVVNNYPLAISKNEDGSWQFTMPDFSEGGELDNGGRLELVPTYETCTHNNGKRLVNKVDAVCMYDGYSGDYVCADCGQITSVSDVGSIIPAPSTEHEGEWELIEGTAVTGSCTQQGYSGDYKCSACGDIKEGENLGYKHGETELRNAVQGNCVTPAYSGDAYCKDCGAKVRTGRFRSMNANKHEHTTIVGAYAPTCVKSGSTGEVQCADCGKTLVKARSVAPLGHEWDEGTVTKEATETENGTKVYHCTRRYDLVSTSEIARRRIVLPIRKAKCNATKTVELPSLSSSILTNVDVAVTAPADGGTASAATTTETGCSVANTSWLDREGNDVTIGSAFEVGKVYVVKVELEATGNSAFTEDTVFTVNGEAATIVTFAIDSVTLNYTFPAVEAVGPTNPTNPSNPTNPTEPTNPSNPTEPTTPTNPTNPSNPTNPTDPTNPAEPTTPTNPTEPADKPQAPATGDESMIALWVAMLFVSGVGVVGTTVYFKKEKR